jgi:hypothetical protein
MVDSGAANNMADSQGAWGEWLARDISCRESWRIVYNPLEEDQSIGPRQAATNNWVSTK